MLYLKPLASCQSLTAPKRPEWVFFFTSSISLGLCIPFLPSGRHLLLFPSTRSESFSTLLLPSGLFLSISCVSKLFERIILSRLLFFLESNSIFSARQAGFRPRRSTLDQMLYFSQFISDGFDKPRPGSRTIRSSIDFSKAIDFVWHRDIYIPGLASRHFP